MFWKRPLFFMIVTRVRCQEKGGARVIGGSEGFIPNPSTCQKRLKLISAGYIGSEAPSRGPSPIF